MLPYYNFHFDYNHPQLRRPKSGQTLSFLSNHKSDPLVEADMAREFKNSHYSRVESSFSSRVKLSQDFSTRNSNSNLPEFPPSSRVRVEFGLDFSSRVRVGPRLDSTRLEKLETYVTYICEDKSLAGLFVRY